MGFAADQLRDKALLALEEAVQECRYRKPRRNFAIRFAMAYLWSLKPTIRAPFEEYWTALAKDDMWRFTAADFALEHIYRHLGVRRCEDLANKLWKQRFADERATKERLS